MTKKVVMLVENLSVPTDPRVWREACVLRDNGIQVSIIGPKGSTRDREAYINLDGIHIYRYTPSATSSKFYSYLKEYSEAMLKTFWLSLKVWRRHDFDVIHTANPPDIFFVIGLFYRLFGKKFIFDQHDLAPEIFRERFRDYTNSIYKLLLWLEWCTYHTADIVITSNESQRNIAKRRGGCSPEKVIVVRNGPEIRHFEFCPVEMALKCGKRYLLAYVGVMGAQDGVEYLLYALERLVYYRGRRDILLALIGDGDQLSKLKVLSQQLELDEYVYFTGWIAQQEVLRYLAAADIGLSPDPSTTLNDHSTMLKTMEYMAMGKPVVAFDLPETRYSAQDSALYATHNDVGEFADNIEKLLNDPELRNELGSRGRKRIEESLCWEQTQKTLWWAYEQLFATDTRFRAATYSLPQCTSDQE